MPRFTGAHLAEPLVGEVIATRTFRVDGTGTLVPLFSHEAWYDGPNTAVCRPPGRSESHRTHPVPDERCECGFYAYGTTSAAARNRHMRHVQAVVSCWGGVIAGTQGVRSQHARVDALWLSPHAPEWLRRRVAVRYPSARLYADRALMLAEHPLSVLPCYRPERRRWLLSTLLTLLAAVLIVVGLLPWHLLDHGTAHLEWLGLLAAAAVGTGVCAFALRGPGHVAAAGLCVVLGGWLASPALGLWGWLVRAPLIYSALGVLARYLLSLRPRHFPIMEYERSATPFDGRF